MPCPSGVWTCPAHYTVWKASLCICRALRFQFWKWSSQCQTPSWVFGWNHGQGQGYRNTQLPWGHQELHQCGKMGMHPCASKHWEGNSLHTATACHLSFSRELSGMHKGWKTLPQWFLDVISHFLPLMWGYSPVQDIYWPLICCHCFVLHQVIESQIIIILVESRPPRVTCVHKERTLADSQVYNNCTLTGWQEP